MPTEPRDLSENWREEWLAEDAAKRRESVGDIAKEATRFALQWWLWSLVSLLVFVVGMAIIAGLFALFG